MRWQPPAWKSNLTVWVSAMLEVTSRCFGSTKKRNLTRPGSSEDTSCNVTWPGSCAISGWGLEGEWQRVGQWVELGSCLSRWNSLRKGSEVVAAAFGSSMPTDLHLAFYPDPFPEGLVSLALASLTDKRWPYPVNDWTQSWLHTPAALTSPGLPDSPDIRGPWGTTP